MGKRTFCFNARQLQCCQNFLHILFGIAGFKAYTRHTGIQCNMYAHRLSFCLCRLRKGQCSCPVTQCSCNVISCQQYSICIAHITEYQNRQSKSGLPQFHAFRHGSHCEIIRSCLLQYLCCLYCAMSIGICLDNRKYLCFRHHSFYMLTDVGKIILQMLQIDLCPASARDILCFH